MSIPNPFRPVCGPAGVDIPYIMPVMTSATTWSNAESIGASVTYDAVRSEAYPPWAAAATGRYWSVESARLWPALWTFPRPVRLTRISLKSYTSIGWRIKASFYGVKKDGSEDYLCFLSPYRNNPATAGVDSVEYYKAIRIECTNAGNGNALCGELVFEGYYKQ